MWATPSIRADIIGGLAVSYDLSVNGVLKQCIECEGVFLTVPCAVFLKSNIFLNSNKLTQLLYCQRIEASRCFDRCYLNEPDSYPAIAHTLSHNHMHHHNTFTITLHYNVINKCRQI